uniref:Bm8126 n=1 Tax=Brugia malayi TaxID=6279 RepID=A0A1I9GCU0_BRUMA|nr:Bm8126 [Brugia malayi]
MNAERVRYLREMGAWCTAQHSAHRGDVLCCAVLNVPLVNSNTIRNPSDQPAPAALCASPLCSTPLLSILPSLAITCPL